MGALNILPDEIHAECWGNAANIKTQITKTGKSVTTFSIQYGKNGDNKLYQNCVAWGDLSRKFLNRLEKGDLVAVKGFIEKDDYWSERKGTDEYKIIVEIAYVQELYDSDDIDEELDLNDI